MKQEAITGGLDLARSVFQVHAISRSGAMLVRRKLRRAEAIGLFFRSSRLPNRHGGMRNGASLESRLTALEQEVGLMPSAYVKPYVTRGKTVAADARSSCKTVTCPTMRFVAVTFIDGKRVGG